jgi:RNA polymerase sigma-70 factor (family 1)
LYNQFNLTFIVIDTLLIIEPYEEKLLLAEVSSGDEKAFRKLYDAYFDRLSVYVYKFNKSEEATAEIVQDVFLKLWITRGAAKQIDSLQGYLFRSARNRTIDYLRKLARDSNLANLVSLQLSDERNNIEEKLNLSDLQLLINQALEELSEQKKQIFKLSKLDGLSHDEISEAMNLSKSTVKNHLSETLRHLRKHLSQRPDHDYLLMILIFKLLN